MKEKELYEQIIYSPKLRDIPIIFVVRVCMEVLRILKITLEE